MERDMRVKAFMEEYARLMQLFDDIMSMKNAMLRLEVYMVIMCCQIATAVLAVGCFLMCKFFKEYRNRGEYQLEHRFERKCDSCKPEVPANKKPV